MRTIYFLIFLFFLILTISMAAVPQTPLVVAEEPGTVRIAILDTGYGYQGRGRALRLCKSGHKDFSTDKMDSPLFPGVPLDLHAHGTNIAGLVEKYAEKTDKRYCLIIIKIYSSLVTNVNITGDPFTSAKAIRYANSIRVDMINYSGGGDEELTGESTAVKEYINAGGTFVAAAGNDDRNIDKSGYYPASSDKRINVIGNKCGDEKSAQSNYGNTVDRWECGEHAIAFGLIMTGTSQSTAIVTGKLVGERNFEIKKNKIKKIVAIRK